MKFNYSIVDERIVSACLPYTLRRILAKSLLFQIILLFFNYIYSIVFFYITPHYFILLLLIFILFNFILFYFPLFYFILFSFILFLFYLVRHHVISVMFALLDDHPDAIMMWKDTKYLPNECILKSKHYFSGTVHYLKLS